MDGDSTNLDIPETNLSDPDILQVGGNFGVIGLTPRNGETQHFIVHTVSPFAQTASIYVSLY